MDQKRIIQELKTKRQNWTPESTVDPLYDGLLWQQSIW